MSEDVSPNSGPNPELKSYTREAPLVEFTVRGVIIGVAITLIFTAAQVYVGLKAGLTFATSIPAAVISMAILQAFRNATIQENNIVQTIASAAGTLASVIFVLPGLIMIGWWQDVPFWLSFSACAIGGVLGVMYTIPLRRALVSQSTLPYPEGVAAAEVLKVGTQSRDGAREGAAGLVALILGSLGAALLAGFAAIKLVAAEVTAFFKTSFLGANSATGITGESSLALIGAGHLMGIRVGIAMLAGLIIAWGFLMPYLTADTVMAAGSSLVDHVNTVRKEKLRFLGAGVIGIAALWTLGKLILPVWNGLMSALAASEKRQGAVGSMPRQEQDIPISLVAIITLGTLLPAGLLFAAFLQGTGLDGMTLQLSLMGVAYVLFAGLAAAAVCGYMAGLIGSSNSPVSGIGILTVLGSALCVGILCVALDKVHLGQAMVAYALFVTAVVLAVAVIGNDNLQDLKTGQLVDATPWKQQVALIIGVLAGSVVVPLVLQMLNATYGFEGDPNYHALTNQPMNAPQASLISALAKGVIGGTLDWNLLGYGGMIGAVLIAVDFILRKVSNDKFSLPPLGVGLAIYLPTAVTAPVVVGAVAGFLYEKIVSKQSWGEIAKRLGILVVSGFIVGESLFKLLWSFIIIVTQNPAPYEIPNPTKEPMDLWFAVATILVVMVGLYRWAMSKAKSVGSDNA